MTDDPIDSAETWVIVGSSPSAPNGLDMVRASPLPSPCRYIACNAGVTLMRNRQHLPDAAVVLDEYAVKLFKSDFVWAYGCGARLYTYRWTWEYVVAAGMPRGTIGVAVPDVNNASMIYERGRFVNSTFSGLFALQIALATDPSFVVLVGMDGYRGTATDWTIVDTYDGRRGPCHGLAATKTWIAPFIQSAVDAHPETHFTIYGRPAYDVRGKNVSFVDAEPAQGDHACTSR